MNSSLENIPRLGETKIKPKVGEIRLTTDGQRRKVFDGNCWQYLCRGDPNCRIQAKFTCRHHRSYNPDGTLLNQSPQKINKPKAGDIQSLPNGNRRIWRGVRWHNLCRAENCSTQAKGFCKTHQTQRMSLPNSNEVIPENFRLAGRTRSCTLASDKSEKEEHPEAEPEEKITLTSPISKRRRVDENIFETVNALPSEKHELHTRNGRRVRCNKLIWKHLCAGKKNVLYKRKYQRQSLPIAKTDSIIDTDQSNSQQTASLSSDTINSIVHPSSITQLKNSKKRKTMSDINKREHIVPKRKSNGQRQKGFDKPIILHLEPNSTSPSVSASPTKDQSIEEPLLNESEISLSLSLKPNRLNTSYQSIEIPVQSPPINYDSSPAAILEQFGTIIKKEIVEEESLIYVPATYTNGSESPCETLQDFLRAEDIKKKEFKLDCQRISYRLAKIQDCIGNISSITI
ncbi:unnamed protein product [Adineta steineri]|uniref:Uncharacterized protein n=1 Tax=Adineta steineri TaxID=433720 RepID=A0A819Y9T3_9BILA|nr:unnamed protein product [Adineta steineri]CAF0883104.1 unnamed protein product [Adineta steineri]CAF3526733.1 unnamed protein product [Adineta steineri]CAF4154150.1 unnamed protein product [Adineta steineri]